ncbi:GTP 3',8-cyclase MoaA [Beggiatoa alba]|nr:GTP 3',8-cyclase MoaA [Beggiatoa alba]
MSNTPALIDPYQRQIKYLRVSVTDRCDLRCDYCLPKGFKDFKEPDEWLSFDEIARIIAAFARLGTTQIRLTGGEPLVRHNFPELVNMITAIPELNDLSLSTNATRLAKQAADLKQAGIQRINVSLDTLNADKFKQITQGKLQKVLDGLQAAKEAGIQPIKINMVVMKGVNDNEVEDILSYCIENNFTLRFIETMPMGDTGRAASNKYLSLQTVKKQLAQNFNLIPTHMRGGGPARYYNIAHTNTNIGFITPISQHFCETCNRVRLTVDGTLYLCLGQEHSYPLRDLLRDGISDSELEQHIIKAIALKPENHEFSENPTKLVRFMSQTGG